MHQKMSFGELPQDDAFRKGGLHHASPSSSRGFTAGPQSGEARVPLAEEVRECPVCHARCFSDMDVCYNCLHSFTQDRQGGALCSSVVCGEEVPGMGPGSSAFVQGGTPVGTSRVQEPVADVSDCYPMAVPAKGALEGVSAPDVVDTGKRIELVISLSFGQDALSGQSPLVPSVKVETR